MKWPACIWSDKCVYEVTRVYMKWKVCKWSDRVRIWSDRARIWSDRVRIWSDRVRIWSDRVRIWSDRVRIWSDRGRIRSDLVARGGDVARRGTAQRVHQRLQFYTYIVCTEYVYEVTENVYEVTEDVYEETWWCEGTSSRGVAPRSVYTCKTGRYCSTVTLSWQRFHFCTETFHFRRLSRWAGIFWEAKGTAHVLIIGFWPMKMTPASPKWLNQRNHLIFAAERLTRRAVRQEIQVGKGLKL